MFSSGGDMYGLLSWIASTSMGAMRVVWKIPAKSIDGRHSWMAGSTNGMQHTWAL